ncbi:MAG: sulfite exporter TauE/SafE family protein [Pirellulales bacterium]
MSPTEIVIASLVMMVGASVQGSVGFGMGMLTAPLLLLIDPILVPGPVLMAALVLTLLVAHRERRTIDLGSVGWAVVGRLPGAVIGAAILAIVSQRTVAILVGAVVLLAVAMLAAGVRTRRTRGTLMTAGLVSGLTGTLASVGGPPIAMLYHDATGARIRGTLSGFFIIGLVMSLSALALLGGLGTRHLIAAAGLIPGVVIGFVISTHLAPIIDRGQTRRAVLGTSALGGVVVVARALMM